MTPDARARLGDTMHRLSGGVPILSEDVCACGDCVVFAVWVQKGDAERFLDRLESTSGQITATIDLYGPPRYARSTSDGAPTGAIDWGGLKS